MKVLLTGGTGFIGKNLTHILKSKKISVDNIGRELLKNDRKLNEFISSKQFKMKQNYDILIHLAADLDESSKKIDSCKCQFDKTTSKNMPEKSNKSFHFCIFTFSIWKNQISAYR